MAKKYAVELSEEEQALLNEMITSGTQRVRKTNHARILLKADAGWTDERIAAALNVSIPTIQRVRQRFVEQSFEQALTPIALAEEIPAVIGWCSRGVLDCPSM